MNQPKKPKKSARETRLERIEKVKRRLLHTIQVELKNGDISGPDMLALLAFITGSAIAMQDSKVMTSELCLKLVSNNIEAGNAAAIAQVAFGKMEC